MIIKTKICGISTTADYAASWNAGATFVGIVHYPWSPRHLDLEALAKLAAYSAAVSPNALSLRPSESQLELAQLSSRRPPPRARQAIPRRLRPAKR